MGLVPQLSGKAQKAYIALSAEDAVEYAKVKEAILARYDITWRHIGVASEKLPRSQMRHTGNWQHISGT